ncbi:MAG: DUF4252 domain-containing protein [Saprospiraceae bacterium]|nr:DUF4252 domain-containing protein [Saprospiraceae bacterium]
MKTRLMIMAFLTLIATTYGMAQTNALDKFFSSYMDDPSFTVVTISPKMFQMISKLDIEDMEPEVKDLIHNIKGLRILAREDYDGRQLYQEASEKINTNDYDELLRVRDKDENVRIFVKSQGDIINELLLIVGGSSEFVLLDLTGAIDLKTVGKLGGALDVPGIQHLEKMSDEKH